MRTLPPGKIRHYQRLLSADGFFQVCAIDHLDEFVELLGPVDQVPFADIVAAKARVLEAVTPELSAVLIDPRYGMGAMLSAGAVDSRLGLVTALEDETYTFPNGPRPTKLRENWDAAKSAACGADLLKMLWFYRPDLDQDVAQAQRDLLVATQAQADAVGVPLVIEPIWYAVAGEDPTSPQWRAARIEGCVESALTAAEIGVDMLKLEFPGSVATAEDRAVADAALARIAAGIEVPWVLLSAGVGFDDFCTQLQIAGQNGCSGYMAGRSVWRDVVEEGTAESLARAKERIVRLNEVIAAHGRPFTPTLSLEQAAADFGPTWYA